MENEEEGNNQFFPAHVCLAKQIYGERFDFFFKICFELYYVIQLYNEEKSEYQEHNCHISAAI